MSIEALLGGTLALALAPIGVLTVFGGHPSPTGKAIALVIVAILALLSNGLAALTAYKADRDLGVTGGWLAALGQRIYVMQMKQRGAVPMRIQSAGRLAPIFASGVVGLMIMSIPWAVFLYGLLAS